MELSLLEIILSAGVVYSVTIGSINFVRIKKIGQMNIIGNKTYGSGTGINISQNQK